MEHLTFRCKHCRKLYTYCTYGNGPEYGTEEGCSKEYCAECQTAINETLKKIPIKFKPIKVEIKDDVLLEKLLEIKKQQENSVLNKIVAFTQGDYDNVDTYTYQGKTYYIQYNDDTPNDLHLFVEKEYDILNQKATNNFWKTDKGNTYMHGHGFALPNVLKTVGNIEIKDRYNINVDISELIDEFEIK